MQTPKGGCIIYHMEAGKSVGGFSGGSKNHELIGDDMQKVPRDAIERSLAVFIENQIKTGFGSVFKKIGRDEFYTVTRLNSASNAFRVIGWDAQGKLWENHYPSIEAAIKDNVKNFIFVSNYETLNNLFAKAA